MRVIVFLLFLVSFFSCQQDAVFIEQEPVQNAAIDARLLPYFEQFESEAARRGIRIDLSSLDISGEISAINENRVAGQCSYGGFHPPHVTIDSDFWNRSSTLYREYIVFHELGHCALFQGHREACLPNRTYASLMRSGNGDCFDNYTAQTRAYYIDELFGFSE